MHGHVLHDSVAVANCNKEALLNVCRVSFCLQHAAACRAHPRVAEYGVGVRVSDLQYLVLSDRAAVDAGGDGISLKSLETPLFCKPFAPTRLQCRGRSIE